MAATLHDVARLAGVSIKTVSNVVNDYEHVRASTRQRVQEAIDELSYQPNLSARNLRSGRSGVITLAVPDLGLSYFAQLAAAVIERAETHGLIVQVEQTNGDRDREIAVLRSARRQLADGLIFSPLGMGQDDAELLRVGYPMVLLGERIFGGPVHHVTMRNREAAYAATSLLLSRGRRRIAIVGAHENEIIGSAGLRREGYERALRDMGVELDESLIGYTTLWHSANGAVAMTELIERGAQFDAVFALNDALALGAMRALQRAGFDIPGDVSVVGFDNVEEAEYAVPALTTVDPGRSTIAEHAVDLLLQTIADRQTPQSRTEILADYRIVERESH